MVKIVKKTWQIDRFNNGPCQGDSKNGTCYTTEECETKGGTNSGSCASGYGVCCTCNKLWFFNEKIPNFIIVKHFSYCQMWSSNKRKLHIFWIFRIGNWTMWDQNLQMWLEYLSSILFPSFSILRFWKWFCHFSWDWISHNLQSPDHQLQPHQSWKRWPVR